MTDVEIAVTTGTADVPAATARSFIASAGQRFAGARSLALNGGALIVNVVVSALTGLGFWIISARTASPDVVAQASAAVTAIISVVSLAQQSFVLTLPSLLSVSPEPRRLVRAMYVAAITVTLIAAPLFVVVGPMAAGGLEFLRDWRIGAAFVGGSLIWCVFSLQDAVLTGVRKAKYVLMENASWGLTRLVFLVIAWAVGVQLGVGWLMASWLVPAAAFVLAISWYLFRSPHSPLVTGQGTVDIDRRGFLRYMSAEFLASALSSAVTLSMTAYVLTKLGAHAAAPVLTAASLVVVAEGALGSFAQALAVEASRADGANDRRRGLAQLSALFLGVFSFGAVFVAAVAGHQVMAIFGSSYRDTGGTALAILMLCVPFRSLILVSNADNRIRRQGGRNLIQQAVAFAVCFGLLATGEFTTVASISWLFVGVRAATAIVAGVQLRQGRLRLHSAA